MKNNYVNLINFSFGKYSYSIMRNNDRIVYFEVVNNSYVMPIVSFDLYDNEGKSLTNVNHHFFLNQLVNRINVAYKKGIFVDDKEIIEYLTDLKTNIENDDELKKLFKGSFMDGITPESFEVNKKSLISYLDKFKFDTFVSYNNVSIFDGSLEKEQQDDSVDSEIEVVDDSISSDDAVVVDDLANSSDLEVVDDSDVPASLDDVVFDDKEIESITTNNIETEKSVDFNDLDVVEGKDVLQDTQVIPSSDQVKSYDLFNDMLSSKQGETVNNSFDNVLSNLDDEKQYSTESNNQGINNDVFDVSNSFSQSDSENSVDQFKETFTSGSDNVDKQSVLDDGMLSKKYNVDQNNNSYLDQVKDRIESKSNISSSELSTELEVMSTPVSEMNLEKTFVTDKTQLPELENVDNDSVSTDEKKGNVGVVIFVIVLVILLILFSFFLYNYVF